MLEVRIDFDVKNSNAKCMLWFCYNMFFGIKKCMQESMLLRDVFYYILCMIICGVFIYMLFYGMTCGVLWLDSIS